MSSIWVSNFQGCYFNVPDDCVFGVPNDEIATEGPCVRPDLSPNVLPPNVASVVVLLKAVEKLYRTTTYEATCQDNK